MVIGRTYRIAARTSMHIGLPTGSITGVAKVQYLR